MSVWRVDYLTPEQRHTLNVAMCHHSHIVRQGATLLHMAAGTAAHTGITFAAAARAERDRAAWWVKDQIDAALAAMGMEL